MSRLTMLRQGAEATLYRKGDIVFKIRHSKAYRHSELDQSLRISRTRREASILQRLTKERFPVPAFLTSNNSDTISMRFVRGKRLSDSFESLPVFALSRKIGALVAYLHQGNIIHADLTTSNILVAEKKVYLIDFGLSFQSTRAENKASDLYLFQQSLNACHPAIARKVFHSFLSSYLKNYSQGQTIISRLSTVSLRGRNKRKS